MAPTFCAWKSNYSCFRGNQACCFCLGELTLSPWKSEESGCWLTVTDEIISMSSQQLTPCISRKTTFLLASLSPVGEDRVTYDLTKWTSLLALSRSSMEGDPSRIFSVLCSQSRLARPFHMSTECSFPEMFSVSWTGGTAIPAETLGRLEGRVVFIWFEHQSLGEG